MAKATDTLTALTAERLRELLHYDPGTGAFTWRVFRSGFKPAGSLAGNVGCDGYRRIGVENRIYCEHRLAWLYMTGAWPKHEIDHRNLDKADNRFANLREATRWQNRHNYSVYNGWTGCKGVSLRKARREGGPPCWQIQIAAYGKRYRRNCHGTLEEAAEVYAGLARKLHGEFARTESVSPGPPAGPSQTRVIGVGY